jgi:hypothetical protein
MSDMNTNARDFARNFARYRAIAARGEKIRIAAPDGIFVLTREKSGVTGADLLERLDRLPPGSGLFDEGGADRIEAGRRTGRPAKSPWDS